MAFTQQQLSDLDSAIAEGVLVVVSNGRRLEYRSLDEMIKLRNFPIYKLAVGGAVVGALRIDRVIPTPRGVELHFVLIIGATIVFQNRSHQLAQPLLRRQAGIIGCLDRRIQPFKMGDDDGKDQRVLAGVVVIEQGF